MKKKYHIDMCHGSLFRQIFYFSMPLLGANVMLMMFHAADLIVLGQFASDDVKTSSVASVGASAVLNTLLLIFFSGFSAGVNSITARYIGAKDHKKVTRTVHTSIALGIYGGIFAAVLGLFLARTALRLMSTPDDVIGKATLYLQIYSIGLPFTVIYAIGSAVLRAIGDTKRPLVYILIGGVVNVLLNLFFVSVLKMNVAGVAVATNIANALSAFLVMRTLYLSKGSVRLIPGNIRFHWQQLKEVLWIGIPAGLQGALFTISNIFIQSSVNSLGSSVMAGNAASQSIEGTVNVTSAVYYQTAMSFTGQNFGGKKYKRVIRSIWICLLYTMIFSVICYGGILMAGRPLLGLYNPDQTIINFGMERMVIMMSTSFLANLMNTITGALRGLGHSVKPTVTTIIGACAFRIFWVFSIFPHYRTLGSLIMSYPVSWLLTGLVNGLMLVYVCRQMLLNARDAGTYRAGGKKRLI